MLITSAATFFGGNRVDTLCNVFVLAVIWYKEFITLKNVLIVSIPAIFIMIMVGALRYNFSLSLDAIQRVWLSVKRDKLVADSFTYAYGPTIAAEEMAKVLDPITKVKVLLYNLAYIFIGGAYGKYSLANFTRNYYTHYYGFLGANYFDIWFGAYGGVIAGVSVVIILFLKGSCRRKSTTTEKIVAISALTSTLRWYNYNFMQIYRTGFITLIVWFVFTQIDRILKKK